MKRRRELDINTDCIHYKSGDCEGYQEVMCGSCHGSGEGMADGTICRSCRGDGSATIYCSECEDYEEDEYEEG